MTQADPPSGRIPAWRYAPGLLLVALIAAVSLCSQGLVVFRYVQDTFVTFDAMWRAAAGEVPHIDFPTPIGQAYYWPFAILAKLHDVGVTTVLRANVLVAAVALLACALTLPRRTSPLVFSLAVLTIATTAITPRDLDGGIDSFSFLAPYNLWSFAFILVVPFLALLPAREAAIRGRDAFEGLVLGLVLGILYYLKLTFFLPAVGLAIAGLVLGHLRPVAFAAAVASGLAMAAGVELAFHNNAAYLADIATAAKASAQGVEGLRVHKALRHVGEAGVYGLVLVAAIWLARPDRNLVRWGFANWRALLVAAGVVLAGAAIATQNHPQHQLAMNAAGLLVGLELARRRTGVPTSAGPVPAALAWGAAFAVAAALPLLDTASIVAHTVVSRGHAVCQIPALKTLRPGLLVRSSMMTGADCAAVNLRWVDVWHVPAGPETKLSKESYFAVAQVQQVQEGTELLARHRKPGDVVFAAAFSNPYPFVLGAPPPRSAQIWWHQDRNFSRSYHPDPAKLLHGVSFVMLAKQDWFARDVWNIYGSDVTRDFKLVEETPRWSLWQRSPAAVSAASASAKVAP